MASHLPPVLHTRVGVETPAAETPGGSPQGDGVRTEKIAGARDVDDAVVEIAVNVLGSAIGVEINCVLGSARDALIKIDGYGAATKIVRGAAGSGKPDQCLKRDVDGDGKVADDVTVGALSDGDLVWGDGVVGEGHDVDLALGDRGIAGLAHGHQGDVVSVGLAGIFQC